MYVSTLVKIIICVVVGALLLTSVYEVVKSVLGSTKNKISDLLDYNPDGEDGPGGGDISVPGGSESTPAGPAMFTITYNLNGCTITNNQSEIEKGENYIASLSVPEGSIINISSVSIIMGGVDITGIAYDNGNINILSVSGNITINASSIEMLNAPEINASDKILTMIDTDERATSYDIYIDGEFVATVARGPRSGATTNLKNTKWYFGDKFDFIDITAFGEDGTVGYICFNLTGQLYEVGSKTPYFTTTPDRSYVHFARALYMSWYNKVVTSYPNIV